MADAEVSESKSKRFVKECARRAYHRVAVCYSKQRVEPLTALKPCVESDLPRIARDLCLAAQAAAAFPPAKRNGVFDALLAHTVGCAIAYAEQRQGASSATASAPVGCCSLCFDDETEAGLKRVATVPASPAAASGVVYLCCDCAILGRLRHREFLRACGLSAGSSIDAIDMTADNVVLVPDWREFLAFQCLNAVICWPADRELQANVSALVRRDREMLAYRLRAEFIFVGEDRPLHTQTFFLSRLPAGGEDGRGGARTWGFFFGTNAIIVPVHQGLVVAAPCEPTKFRQSSYWVECLEKGFSLSDVPHLTVSELDALTVDGTDTPVQRVGHE